MPSHSSLEEERDKATSEDHLTMEAVVEQRGLSSRSRASLAEPLKGWSPPSTFRGACGRTCFKPSDVWLAPHLPHQFCAPQTAEASQKTKHYLRSLQRIKLMCLKGQPVD